MNRSNCKASDTTHRFQQVTEGALKDGGMSERDTTFTNQKIPKKLAFLNRCLNLCFY